MRLGAWLIFAAAEAQVAKTVRADPVTKVAKAALVAAVVDLVVAVEAVDSAEVAAADAVDRVVVGLAAAVVVDPVGLAEPVPVKDVAAELLVEQPASVTVAIGDAMASMVAHRSLSAIQAWMPNLTQLAGRTLPRLITQ